MLPTPSFRRVAGRPTPVTSGGARRRAWTSLGAPPPPNLIQGKTLRENLFDYGGPEGEARGVSVQVVENVIYGVSRDRADERLEGKRSWRIIGLGLNRNHGGTRLRGSWEIRARWGRPPGSPPPEKAVLGWGPRRAPPRRHPTAR